MSQKPTKITKTDSKISEVELGNTPEKPSGETPPSKVNSGTMGQSTLPSTEKSKKDKIHLTIGIIVGVLALIGLGFFAWYFCIFSQPDNVARDAMNNLFNAKNLALKGSIIMASTEPDSELQSVYLNLSSNSNNLPTTSNADLKVVFKDGNVIDLDLGSIIMHDGVIYLRVSGIMDAIDSFDLTDEQREDSEIFFSALEIVDNEWWEISVPDILAELEVEKSTAKQINSAYDCYVDYMNVNHFAEYGEIYKDHKFIGVEKLGKRVPSSSKSSEIEIYTETPSNLTAYSVEIDYEELANFLNKATSSDSVDEFVACMKKAAPDSGIDISDIDEISASDLKDVMKDDAELYLYITNWTHKLKYLTLEQQNKDAGYDLSGQIEFIYQEYATEAPESYRPIMELYKEVIELFSEAYGNYDPYEIYNGLIYDDIYGDEYYQYADEGVIMNTTEQES